MNIDISSDRKLNIASDLIAGHSWKKIISDNNICKTTFYNLKKHDEEFKKIYSDLLSEIQSDSVDKLKRMFGKAVDTLQDLMDDEDSRIRLEASKAVMSAHTVTITKTEVIDSTTQMSKETFQHYFGDV